MPRRGKNIYKRKDGRWEGRYAKNRDASGKTIYGSVYGKTYTEVKQRLAEVSVAESTNDTLRTIISNKHHPTFADVASQ